MSNRISRKTDDLQARVRLVSVRNGVETEAAVKTSEDSNERRRPLEPISINQRDVDSVCFVVPGLARTALLSVCTRVCVTALFPDESNVICHSLSLSRPLSPSGLLPSLVRVRE